MNRNLVAIGEKLHTALLEYAHNYYTDIQTNLSGGCAIASALLVREAKRKLGIHVKFAAVHGHAWTEYGGYIYDVTAIQFDSSAAKVLTLPISSVNRLKPEDLGWAARYYMDNKRIDLPFLNKDWPSGQQPRNYDLKWINQHKARLLFIGKRD